MSARVVSCVRWVVPLPGRGCDNFRCSVVQRLLSNLCLGFLRITRYNLRRMTGSHGGDRMLH